MKVDPNLLYWIKSLEARYDARFGDDPPLWTWDDIDSHEAAELDDLYRTMKGEKIGQ